MKAVEDASRAFSGVFLVIDGLDESSNRPFVLKAIRALEKTNVKFLITSRDTPEIREALGQESSVELTANKLDIVPFINNRLEGV
jgi:hypothetical protein